MYGEVLPVNSSMSSFTQNEILSMFENKFKDLGLRKKKKKKQILIIPGKP
jgi:hypothetical protein